MGLGGGGLFDITWGERERQTDRQTETERDTEREVLNKL